MTSIYLAGAEVDTLTRALLDGGCKKILYSFFYIHQFGRENAIDRYQELYPDVKWFLDSGAFTFAKMQALQPHKLPDPRTYKRLYFDYIERTGHRWERIAELDLDGHYPDLDYVALEEWREEMLERWPDLPITYVWHHERGIELWNLYCRDDRIKHLGIGSGYSNFGQFRRMVMQAAEFKKSVHGFAQTKVNTSLRRIPWTTVDSTSWLAGQQYGTIYVFRANKFTVLSRSLARGKFERKRYAQYFRNIGCDPDLIFNDDVAEVRKANVKAWVNLANRFEEMRKWQNRRFDLVEQDPDEYRNPALPWDEPKPRERPTSDGPLPRPVGLASENRSPRSRDLPQSDVGSGPVRGPKPIHASRRPGERNGNADDERTDQWKPRTSQPQDPAYDPTPPKQRPLK